MGFLKGIISTVTSPVSLVGKSLDKIFTEEWETKDIFTLGATKVVESAKETVEEIEDDFED